MTYTVSISQFRENLSKYLNEVKNGHEVIIQDDKKDQEVARLIGKKPFDSEAYSQALQKAAGSISAENHPEWTTIDNIISWVNNTRKSSERSFDDLPD